MTSSFSWPPRLKCWDYRCMRACACVCFRIMFISVCLFFLNNQETAWWGESSAALELGGLNKDHIDIMRIHRPVTQSKHWKYGRLWAEIRHPGRSTQTLSAQHDQCLPLISEFLLPPPCLLSLSFGVFGAGSHSVAQAGLELVKPSYSTVGIIIPDLNNNVSPPADKPYLLRAFLFWRALKEPELAWIFCVAKDGLELKILLFLCVRFWR
jgi:hypothetical protein